MADESEDENKRENTYLESPTISCTVDSGIGNTAEKTTSTTPNVNSTISSRNSTSNEHQDNEQEQQCLYLQRLLELFRRTKEKALNHFDFSSHFAPDLIPPLEELWEQARHQLSFTIDENFKLLMNELKLEEKLTELEKLNDKYTDSSPSWQYSGLPENDAKHFTELAAKDELPMYEELFKKEEEETQRLLQEYQENLSLLTQLKTDTETQLTHIENTLTTYTQ